MYRISILLLLALSALVSYAQPFSGFVSLDGTNDHADPTFGTAILPAAEDFTVESWFRSCGVSGYLLDARDPLTGDGLAISFQSPNGMRIQMRGAGGPAVDTIVGVPISGNGWQHFALVYQHATATASLFVSGRSFATFVAGFSPASDFRFGKDAADASFYDGYVDEMRISNTARYSTPFNPSGPFTPDAQTLALWHFNEAIGTSTFDDASTFNRDLSPRMGAGAGSTFFVSGGGDICSGGSVELIAGGAVSYSWSPVTGLDDASASNPTASPEESTYYVVSAMDSNSCVSLGLVYVALRPEPEVLVTAAQSVICQGAMTQLFAEGGVSYLWNTGAVSQNPFVNPEETTTYSVEVTDVYGCTAEAGITITVEECSTTGITSAETEPFGLSVGPNPTWGTLYVQFALAERSELNWMIYDVSGRMVRSWTAEPYAAGTHQRTLDTGLDNGSYWLMVQSGSENRSMPFSIFR